MQAAAAASSALELAEHQPTVWAHTNGYISTMTVQCAVQLEIPDVIHSHGRPMTLHQLLSALQISPAKAPFMSRLMRLLVHLGYFVEHNDSYWLTPLSRFLLKDNPFGGRPMLLLGSHPIMLDPWRSMSTWFRTANEDEKQQQQQPPFAFANGGKKLYEVAAGDPWLSRLYHDGLARDSSLFAAALVAKCGSTSGVFEGLKSLVDVGRNSGTGTTGQVLAAAFPDIDITVFDLPHAVAGLEAAAQPNLRYVGGDMFKEIPPADAVLLMRVLIELEDEACVELLKQCKKAVSNRRGGGAGKVMIADHVLGHESCDDQVSEGTLLFTDMVMMACLEGSIRTKPQWSELISQAGFSNFTITPVCGLWFLIQLEL